MNGTQFLTEIIKLKIKEIKNHCECQQFALNFQCSCLSLVNAVRPCTVENMSPAFVQFLVVGSYSSALLKVLYELPIPPATNTFQFGNSDAVCVSRLSCMLSVRVQVFVDGSYSSALGPE